MPITGALQASALCAFSYTSCENLHATHSCVHIEYIPDRARSLVVLPINNCALMSALRYSDHVFVALRGISGGPTCR